jgi:hypothetical protein
VAPDAPPPQQPPKPAVLFTAVAPTRFTLQKPHQVRIDEVPQLPLKAGRLQQTEVGYRTPGLRGTGGAMPPLHRSTAGQKPLDAVRNFNASSPNGILLPGSAGVFRHLTLLLTRTGARLQLRALNGGSLEVPAKPSWAFVLAERTEGVSDASPVFTFGGRPLQRTLTAVVVVERDNRFNVEGLENAGVWRLALRPLEGEHPASVVMKVTPVDETRPALFDGAPLEGRTVVLEPKSSHTLSGASAAWLAVPTLSGLEPGELEVTFEQATPQPAAVAPATETLE